MSSRRIAASSCWSTSSALRSFLDLLEGQARRCRPRRGRARVACGTGRSPGGGQSRTRLERVRASVGIASLALQQIEDDLSADDVDQGLAAILRELIEDTNPPGGFISRWWRSCSPPPRAVPWSDRDGDASCPLHEAAALITDNAGQRLIWAARSLHPQGAS